VRYLARHDRTRAQVEEFLKSKGASPAQVKQIIGRLHDLRYLDDHAYAERWVESRLARKPMGRERLKAELLATGVEEALAEQVIDRALPENGEEALARRVLRMRQYKGRRLLPLQAARLLRQRGFSEDTVDRIMGDRSGTGEYDS
jgi:regulatory protein